MNGMRAWSDEVFPFLVKCVVDFYSMGVVGHHGVASFFGTIACRREQNSRTIEGHLK
jgi:hypothetical protein